MTAPSAASALAMALPIPRDDPVTTATFPASRFDFSFSGEGAEIIRSPSWDSSLSCPMLHLRR